MSGETIHERYMRLALEEAKEANRLGKFRGCGSGPARSHIGSWAQSAPNRTQCFTMRKCWRWKKPAVLSVIGGWMDAIYM